EVMGIDPNFGIAFAKTQISTNQVFPTSGSVFISVNDKDKDLIVSIAKKFSEMDFKIISTKGTGDILTENGIKTNMVLKIREGRPNVIDMIKNREIDLIINTPEGSGARSDGYYMRTAAVLYNVPSITTLSAVSALLQGIEEMRKNSKVKVKAIQEY
ncbi:MAG TPA: carbamoyl phosphate synthase large subunit, partial [Actinobacteria bacterium]|nr:carbamoyl phosphate synthase large subunit [Actinomycetota bacterium]